MSCFLTPGFARSPKAIRLASADQVGPEVSPLPFVSRVRPVPEADIVHNPPGATKAMRFPSGDQAVDSDASSNSGLRSRRPPVPFGLTTQTPTWLPQHA